jgi:SAM-dependent methyltransferase
MSDVPDSASRPVPVTDYSTWRAEDYFRTYYSEVVLPDEQVVLRYELEVLRARGREYARAVEYGCGPTLHRAIAAAPQTRHLELADWLPDNLAYVRQWLDAEKPSEDWNRFTDFLLRCEGRVPTRLAIEQREAQTRRAIRALRVSDARWRHPLGPDAEGAFDLLISGFCLDAVSARKDVWARCMRNVLSMLAPGGQLILHALHRCRAYKVGERLFPGANVSVDEMRMALLAADFDPASLDVQVVPTPDNAIYGYAGILVVSGQRKG